MSELTKEEIQSKFEKLGLSVHISEPMPKVDKDWLGIKYIITLSKGTHSSQQIELEYTLGLGHVKYTKILPYTLNLTDTEANVLDVKSRKPYAQIKKEYAQCEVSLAVKLAKRQKVQPNPAEVLICYCREALEATEQTFEEWASNFGYDEDSRKAEKAYNHGRDSYSKLLKIINKQQIEEFAQIEL